MTTTSWGRSLATPGTAPPAQPAVGDPSPSAPTAADGLTPSTACTIINRRPSDLVAFQAACAAAPGQPILELAATQAVPGMRIWCTDRFRTVSEVYRSADWVELTYAVPNGTAQAWMNADAPLYRLETS